MQSVSSPVHVNAMCGQVADGKDEEEMKEAVEGKNEREGEGELISRKKISNSEERISSRLRG